MLGARDLAFPRLNLASWYLFVMAGIVVLYALFVGRGRYRLDFLHPAVHLLFERPCGSWRPSAFSSPVFLPLPLA